MNYTFINDNNIMPTFSKIDDVITLNLSWYNNSKINYYFQSSVEKYHEIIEIYGLPDMIVYEMGGLCVWIRRDFYEKITLYDAIKINKFPVKHNNILSLDIYFPISMDKWQNIELFCSNISYDHLSKIITIKCPTISYGNAILSFIIDYMENKISLNSIRNNPLFYQRVKVSRLTDIKEQNKDISNIKRYLKIN